MRRAVPSLRLHQTWCPAVGARGHDEHPSVSREEVVAIPIDDEVSHVRLHLAQGLGEAAAREILDVLQRNTFVRRRTLDWNDQSFDRKLLAPSLAGYLVQSGGTHG